MNLHLAPTLTAAETALVDAFSERLSELPGDPRYQTNPSRVANRASLREAIVAALASREKAVLLASLETAGVPASPINTIAEMFADRQVVARGMRLELPHSQYGSVPSIANPMRFSETAIEYGNGPPALGQHTHAVLRQLLGLDPDALQALQKDHVIGEAKQ